MILLSLVLTAQACLRRADTPESRASRNEIGILLEAVPATLEPRNTLDAQGQRLNMLLFRALTQLDPNLELQPDLARRWWPEDAGRRWIFEIRPGEITAERLAACLQSYLTGDSPSLLKASFPSFRNAHARGNQVRVDLSEPDPFFPRNASLIRYYTEAGTDVPCSPIRDPARVQGHGPYELRPFVRNPERELILHPRKGSDAPILRFQIVKDETARLQKLLTGEADAAANSFGASKWKWIRENQSEDFQFFTRDGVNVSYLAFQYQDPILSKALVRRAIAHAIPIDVISRHKISEITSPAGSFLSSRLPGGVQTFLSFSPETSERLLDQAGYPKNKDGIRFSLKYKTTTNREGFDAALIFQDALGKVGIRLDLEVVEPAVFFSSTRKGNFQMFSSRWIGISDPSIFYRTLSRESADNRVRYHHPRMESWVSQLKRELDPIRRAELVKNVQLLMAEEVPYFPLWFWTNNLILRQGITGVGNEDLSLSGSYLPFQKLRWKR